MVLPDTQFYSCSYPDIFDAQTRWIVDNAKEKSFGIVLHTGDLVDRNTEEQWDVAAGALRGLDGVLPYLLVPGNHDLSKQRGTLMNDYFSSSALSNGGCTEMHFKDAKHVDNAYAVVSLRGEPWLFLGLEFGPRDAVLGWADEVLREHSELPAVLFTHAYLYADNERYDRSRMPLQPYHPDEYEVTPDEGIADGQDIWETLVVPNDNVRLVLSGHVIPDGTARSVVTMPSGRVVHEVLTNYQLCDECPCAQVEGGGGYLRLFELDASAGSLHVSTYSPYRDEYLTDAENQFDLAL